VSAHVAEAGTLVDLVDELEHMVSSARRLPLSTSVMLDEDALLELVDRIRLGLPEELVRARDTVEDAQRVMESAQDEADRLVEQAEQHAARTLEQAGEQAAVLVSQHHIVSQAQAHADALVEDAETRAAAVRGDADAYARDVMAHLEEQLTRALGTVRRGLETLPRPEPQGRGIRRRR
jgi:cell division septum initiation protein DivIVA